MSDDRKSQQPGPRDPQREKQLERGAQSDQGEEGQKLDMGGNKPRAYEGPEESNQQRR